ncbi:7341_t:CDS:1, partial [Dentiscutata erythropus]
FLIERPTSWLPKIDFWLSAVAMALLNCHLSKSSPELPGAILADSRSFNY